MSDSRVASDFSRLFIHTSVIDEISNSAEVIAVCFVCHLMILKYTVFHVWSWSFSPSRFREKLQQVHTPSGGFSQISAERGWEGREKEEARKEAAPIHS